MINSPRTLLRGYAYRDTLAHEFVHFLVYQRFGESTPIWLHEGIAKYSELRWRGGANELAPSSRSLLAFALRQGELIGFDRMHPSFAKLKTPSQGQLAFAEVATVVDYMVKTGGWDLVFRLCDELTRNPDYRAAIRQVTGKPFERFWQDWIAYAKTLGYRELPGVEISVYEIRKGEPGSEGEADEEVSESEVSESPEMRYARLGDLLRDRGHYPEAAVEYERARALAPFLPRILNKCGLAYFLAGQYERGIPPLQQAIELYPSFSTTYINLGRTLFALDRRKEAERMFSQALDLNPFNPIPYGYLIKISEARGDSRRARELSEELKIISG
jgi:tetratricopeptide (TPR) repeat protein